MPETASITPQVVAAFGSKTTQSGACSTDIFTKLKRRRRVTYL